MKHLAIIFSLMLVTGLGIVHAQSPMQMVINMNNVYAKAASYSMTIEMDLFMGTNDVTPLHSYKGEACKSGNLYYSSLMGKTTVCNKECTVFIDDGQKTIIYSKNPDEKRKKDEPEESIIPDTSDFGKEASYAFGKGTATAARIIIIPVDQSLYKKIELLINRTSFVMEEIAYSYSDNEDFSSSLTSTRIRYTSVNLTAQLPASKFSEKTFVTRSNGKLSGVGKYASYEVIEQKNELPQ